MKEDQNALILTLIVKDASALRVVYMDYTQNGALFVPTTAVRNLDSMVSLLIKVPNFPMLKTVGKVVWVTPKGAQGGRPAGLGVQLSQGESKLRDHIESLIQTQGGHKTRITHTI